MEIKDILVINPGSTSTKIAVFSKDNETKLFEKNIVHDEQRILSFPTIIDQDQYRKQMIIDFLAEENYDMTNLTAVVGRGGMAYELEGGGYRVNQKLCDRMGSSEIPSHASSLGAVLAFQLAEPLGLPSYIYDSTMGCDLLEIAKITGINGIEKYGAIHLLNSRAQAIRYAESIGKSYQDLRAIICHMGGGITVNAQVNGKAIDTSGYDEGPMSPERSGGMPLLLFNKLAFSGKYSEKEVATMISGKGGLYSYLSTKNCIEIEGRIKDGDEYAQMIYEAMALQVAKAIAGLSCTLKGDVDVIILTGGIAHSKMLTDMIKGYCQHIGKIVVMGGEVEMEALAGGAIRMLKGEEETKEYIGRE